MKAYFVLPHGLLFNHTQSAVEFQRRWFQTHAVDLVLNLADYQRFLFEEAEALALVVRYAKARPADTAHRIDYWSPKTDWAVTRAGVVTVLPQDRARLTVREVLADLRGIFAPLIWKERDWATSRDRCLLDRLKLYPPAPGHTRAARQSGAEVRFVPLPRRWVVERTCGWPARFRRRARDYGRTAEVLAGWHGVAFVARMLHRPALLPLPSS